MEKVSGQRTLPSSIFFHLNPYNFVSNEISLLSRWYFLSCVGVLLHNHNNQSSLQ